MKVLVVPGGESPTFERKKFASAKLPEVILQVAKISRNCRGGCTGITTAGWIRERGCDLSQGSIKSALSNHNFHVVGDK